jgi:hypothetical protein
MISSVGFDGMTKTRPHSSRPSCRQSAGHALLRAKSPGEVLELQQRFVREYLAVLMQGAMTFVNAVESAAGWTGIAAFSLRAKAARPAQKVHRTD